jgi:hypothetical protein
MTLKKVIRPLLITLAIVLVLILAAFVFVFFAVKYGWTNTKGVIDTTFPIGPKPAVTPTQNPAWASTEEWQTLRVALAKDKAIINRVSAETGISGRLLVTMIAPEQLRLYFSNRQIFKEIFAPLKILGNEVQFSWGVAGLKQETAKQIEARDNTGLLAFASSTTDRDEERFLRIANEKNHYYSYLYTALFLKQIMAQWREAGFPIDNRPEILATLFNIGFEHSTPNAEPKVGGSAITIDGNTYSFGGIAYQFYYSDELINEFPR